MRDVLLVLNAGSSSLKFGLYDVATPSDGAIAQGHIQDIGPRPERKIRIRAGDLGRETLPPLDHAGALANILGWIDDAADLGRISAVGHRVVHGGSLFRDAVLIDDAVVRSLRALVPLAPQHQPHNLAAIDEIARTRPGLPQVACFDTAFHTTQPDVAQRFALPRAFWHDGIRRYGFHGLSYEYIAGRLPAVAGPVAAGRIVVCHLGHGCSLCALAAGRSVATTMGYTTLDGLPMGRRAGAIDPGLVLHLLTLPGWDAEKVTDLLYNRSGLLGVSGISDDMKLLLASDHPAAKEAVELFVYRTAREIGSLVVVLKGLDGVVFTGGIGENAAPVREAIGAHLRWLGVDIDPARNVAGETRISRDGSAVQVWVVPTDEEAMIATHTRALIRR